MRKFNSFLQFRFTAASVLAIHTRFIRALLCALSTGLRVCASAEFQKRIDSPFSACKLVNILDLMKYI